MKKYKKDSFPPAMQRVPYSNFSQTKIKLFLRPSSLKHYKAGSQAKAQLV